MHHQRGRGRGRGSNGSRTQPSARAHGAHRDVHAARRPVQLPHRLHPALQVPHVLPGVKRLGVRGRQRVSRARRGQGESALRDWIKAGSGWRKHGALQATAQGQQRGRAPAQRNWPNTARQNAARARDGWWARSA